MKNKKVPLMALGLLAVGAISSVAYQSFAQTPTPVVSPQVVQNTSTDQNIDQKDAQGNDLETNDDSTTITSEKESANDNDSDTKSEQSEKNGGQNDTQEQED